MYALGMKHKRLAIFVTISYVLLSGHFLYSYFYKVIGPNYTIRSSGYLQDSPTACIPSEISDCVMSCPAEVFGPNPDGYRYRGFPFATNGNKAVCPSPETDPYPTKDFNLARIMNWMYFAVLTGLFVSFLSRTRRTRSKVKARVPARA